MRWTNASEAVKELEGTEETEHSKNVMQKNMSNKFIVSPLSAGLLVSLCFGAAHPAAAFQAPRKVLPSFQGTVSQLRKVTRVPVALPTEILDKFRCFVLTLTQDEYEVDLMLPGSLHDDEANSLGAIGGRKITGKKTSFIPLYGTRNYPLEGDEKAKVQPVILAHGIKGYFLPEERGVSLVFWHQEGYSYVVAYKGSKLDVVQIANSAILNER